MHSAGRERCASPRHRWPIDCHARHSLGLRIPHWWRRRIRRARGCHLPRRRRLRHQLRCAPAPDPAPARRDSAQTRKTHGHAVSGDPFGRGIGAIRHQTLTQRARPRAGTGRQVDGGPGLRHPERSRRHRGQRAPPRRTRPCERTRQGAGPLTARHRRQRQPLRGSGLRGGGVRRRNRRPTRPRRRNRHVLHPFGLARPGLSGVRRPSPCRAPRPRLISAP